MVCCYHAVILSVGLFCFCLSQSLEDAYGAATGGPPPETVRLKVDEGVAVPLWHKESKPK